MRRHDFYYNSQSKTCTLLVLAIFSLAVTVFALLEVTNFYSDEPTVARMFLNSFKSSEENESLSSSSNKFVFVNLEEQEKQQIKEKRAAGDNNTNSIAPKSNSYYEEQTPVVVYSKTDIDPSTASREMAEVSPKQDADEEDPYYSKNLENDYDPYYGKDLENDYEGKEDNDYISQQEKKEEGLPAYYSQQQQQHSEPYYRQQPPANYYRQPQSYYRKYPPSSKYYDNARVDFRNADNEQSNSEDARSSQYRDYETNYGQYPYATASPILAGVNSGNIKRLSAANSNMQFLRRKAQPQYREPFPTYMDDYDYPPSQSHSSAPQRPPYVNRKTAAQQMPQYRTPSSSLSSEEKQEFGQQLDFLTMFKYLKTMWDIYQSFTSSWTTLAEKRNREQAIAKEKHKQVQQIRINSKKPPKFNTRGNITANNKNNRKQIATTSTTVEPPASEIFNSDEQVEEQTVKKQPMATDEPRKSLKGTKEKIKDEENLRDKRQAGNGMKESTDVGVGRYIKGDPLKGYYDFVITEGSYKFWAVFQVGTAILIIYSTFAAIYYSKVNPLVSDYDYTDYLGGARSLSGGDLDFVDDDESGVQKTHPKSWLEWLPRTGHSLQFILDAIDKLPTDHAAKEDINKSYKTNNNEEINADEIENLDEAEPAARTDSSNEFGYTSEKDFPNENENLNIKRLDNRAM